jgi:CheY-like chemotaxis protein
VDEHIFHDALRLTIAQRSDILDSLDLTSSIDDTESGNDRRQGLDIRLPYRKSEVELIVEHPGGGISRFYVVGRNLTPRGFASLHGGYLHAGAKCRIKLPLAVGGSASIRASVLWCRHVRDHIHEIGFRFEQPIDLWRFVEGAEAAVDATSRIDPSELAGNIAIFSDLELMGEVYQHELRETQLEVNVYSNLEDLLESIGSQSTDLIICDIDLDSTDAIATMKQIRETSYYGTLLIATGEPSSQRLQPIRSAGADGVLRKPFRPMQLFAVLLEWLTMSNSDSTQADASTEYAVRDGVQPLLDKFVSMATEISSELTKGMESDDLASVRSLCRRLYETAGVFGFAGLSQSARVAMTELDASCSIEESKTQLQNLLLICGRVSAALTAGRAASKAA